MYYFIYTEKWLKDCFLGKMNVNFFLNSFLRYRFFLLILYMLDYCMKHKYKSTKKNFIKSPFGVHNLLKSTKEKSSEQKKKLIFDRRKKNFF